MKNLHTKKEHPTPSTHSTPSALPSSAHLLIDAFELPGPLGVVQELPQVKAVVVGGVALGMVSGRQRGHLVPIDGVAAEEVLDLVGHLGEDRSCTSQKMTSIR